MGWLKQRWKYLSFRVTALTACWLSFTIWGIFADLPPLVALPGLAAFLAVGWFAIARPFLRLERMTSLFLEGYDLTTSDEMDNVSLSAASHRLFLQLREVLSPSQLFHMNKRQAQYLALQNQINPHFLYNTLESIRSETLISGLADVANMTESLATFFRYTITKVENLVSVEEELENCETYFRIQKYRFGDRLMLEICCNPEDRDEIYRYRLPKLTMQPILENAIIHGTELKIGAGHLVIRLERTEKRLLIRISDDGLGMDEATLAKLNAKFGRDNFGIAKGEQPLKGGLALVNVDNRIRLLFGDEYGLHVFSVAGAGTDVEISLPAISSDREVENSEVLQ